MNTGQRATDIDAASNSTSSQRQPQKNTQRNTRNTAKPRHDRLLAYWAFARPHHARIRRVAFLQPALGILCTFSGIAVSLVGWLAGAAVWGVVGIILTLLGLAIVGIAYWISVLYYKEYPGGFSDHLEEYVARRVSRLSRDRFIPRYKPRNTGDAKKITAMNSQVSLALQAEMLRLQQPEQSGEIPVCGVLVVGGKHSNKTGGLWDAMTELLGDWTFVRWPHHMDYPTNLAPYLGQRIVLWLDDLHDFANVGEAAALDQFIQELRKERQQFLVLASCRAGEPLREAERYLMPLMRQLKPVPATEPLPLTRQFNELLRSFEKLPDSQKSVLQTIDWLESLDVNTFPWEVLASLSDDFLSIGAVRDSEEVTLKGLDENRDSFVQVNRRADPQIPLPPERYDLARWFRHIFYPRKYLRRHDTPQLVKDHLVLEPVNVNYLNLEASRAVRTSRMTNSSEKHPEHLIEQLSESPFAAETLILLGDAYLNHLGEDIDNAVELAELCYDGALESLKLDDFSKHFSGAWAAAHVGKGNAALRARNLSTAIAEFEAVTQRDTPTDGVKPIPRLLVAHAWHGQGDAIAAGMPSEVVKVDLNDAAAIANAATYFANAASAVPHGDPLQTEAQLDRAHVLYVIARVAAKRFAASLATTPLPLPTDEIDAAIVACREVRENYNKTTAPAVWAELQRRLGDLNLMKVRWVMPLSLQLQPPLQLSTAAANLLASRANAQASLEMAKEAREYFTAACTVFAPSYMFMDWLNSQVGLIRSQLIVARLLEASDPETAKELYLLSLSTIDAAIEQIDKLGHTPFDWVDLQMLRVHGEVDIGRLERVNASSAFDGARGRLQTVIQFLEGYLILDLLKNEAAPSRLAAQLDEARALSSELGKGLP